MDSRTWTLLLNTALLAAAVTAISVPVGTLLAWLLARTDVPGRRIGVALLAAMLFVPLYLQAAAWQAGFGLQGWYTLAFGGPVWLEGFRAAVWVHAMAAIPWAVLIVGIALRLVEPELEEQAALDGSAWQVFARVTLPGTWAAVGVATLWVAILTAGEMTVTDLFSVRTYAEELYTQTAIGAGPGEASLGVLPGVVLTGSLVAAGLALSARLAPRDRPPSRRRRFVYRLGRWRVPIALLAAAGLLILVGVPLGNLIYKAGVLVSQTETGRIREFSIGKCFWIIAESPGHYRREFGWSAAVGVIAASVAVVGAIALAWPARRGGPRVMPAMVVTAVFLAVPGPMIGLGIIEVMNQPDCPILVKLYDQSILAPVAALAFRGLPLATLILWHAFATLPGEVLDAAAVDGAGPIGRLVRIALPSRLPALALAWLVALAVALGDLAASILVVPPGVTTLSIRIFGLLHYGVEDQVAGICLAQVILFAAIAAVVGWIVRRWE
ncbi:MAG: ABC transporter permease subunit [Planctomycetia bacterium]|nr:ABC transporter permease subunit [Planctomycetia bacterium]